jgi:hypothetical protein
MAATRREVLLAIGAAAAGAFALREATPRKPRRSRSRSTSEVATALPAGMTIGTCTLTSVDPICDGAVPMSLVDSRGRAFQVEVMRFDAAAPGVARAGSLAVYLRNGGDGAKASDEEHGLAAMTIAAEIARRERDGAKVPRLCSVRDRARA